MWILLTSSDTFKALSRCEYWHGRMIAAGFTRGIVAFVESTGYYRHSALNILFVRIMMTVTATEFIFADKRAKLAQVIINLLKLLLIDY